jgi:hypothetical protein
MEFGGVVNYCGFRIRASPGRSGQARRGSDALREGHTLEHR